MIVIDEPELSLHPSLQRNLSSLLIDYSSTRQIVIATHSPYLLELPTLEAGARVARVHQATKGSVISELTVEAGTSLQGFLNDTHNPHVWGLNAKEVFDDGIILVEGQDDVIHYPRLAKQIDLQFQGTFFGWGVGGAPKMMVIAKVLKELGFQKVVGILDQVLPHYPMNFRKSFRIILFLLFPLTMFGQKKLQLQGWKLLALLMKMGTCAQNIRIVLRK